MIPCCVCKKPTALTPEDVRPGSLVLHAKCNQRQHEKAIERLKAEAAKRALISMPERAARAVRRRGPLDFNDLRFWSGCGEGGVAGFRESLVADGRFEYRDGLWRLK